MGEKPEMITPNGMSSEGVGMMSQPGSGATPVSPQGKLAQVQQRQGA